MSQYQSLETQIIARATKDTAFRQNLLRNPKDTIEQEFGVKLPPTTTFQVHEETEAVRHLILPAQIQSPVVELSEDQLAATVGGSKKRDLLGGCTGNLPGSCD